MEGKTPKDSILDRYLESSTIQSVTQIYQILLDKDDKLGGRDALSKRGVDQYQHECQYDEVATCTKTCLEISIVLSIDEQS
mmetsp:Transcript_19919/g.22561  ORF Transcript_19919/g.22561 Transcript_19919/m.22561 type:complete len:81 (+) Transcript_19919:495-737(+)